MSDRETVTVDAFEKDIRRVMALVIAHRDEEARELFNRELYDRYHQVMCGRANHPLKACTVYFLNLNEYINNEGAKILGVTDRRSTVSEYYWDFPTNLAEAKRREQMGRSTSD
jgi:hypothetical protein